VAVSPQINIADPDGKLPADPLIVYDKLLEPVGSLVDALWRRFAAGRRGKLDHLDVEAALPAAMKSRMQEPIRAVRHVSTLPVFDPAQLESFA
jgi:hypothetical protein